MLETNQPIKKGDAVEITLLDNRDEEVTFRGNVVSVTETPEGGETYLVACPFQVGRPYIRLIEQE